MTPDQLTILRYLQSTRDGASARQVGLRSVRRPRGHLWATNRLSVLVTLGLVEMFRDIAREPSQYRLTEAGAEYLRGLAK